MPVVHHHRARRAAGRRPSTTGSRSHPYDLGHHSQGAPLLHRPQLPQGAAVVPEPVFPSLAPAGSPGSQRRKCSTTRSRPNAPRRTCPRPPASSRSCRDPVDRAISHYWQIRRAGRESEDLETALSLEAQRLSREMDDFRHGRLSRAHHKFSYMARGEYAQPNWIAGSATLAEAGSSSWKVSWSSRTTAPLMSSPIGSVSHGPTTLSAR